MRYVPLGKRCPHGQHQNECPTCVAAREYVWPPRQPKVEEPFGYVDERLNFQHTVLEHERKGWIAVFASPQPKRPVVDLTDEEILKAWDAENPSSLFLHKVRAVIKAHIAKQQGEQG